MATQQLSEGRQAPDAGTGGLWRLLTGGTEGNARLTALTGLLIFVLLAAEGVTILDVRGLFIPHAFIGILLIPPIGLKLASVGYRFMSYYAGRPTYRRAGPPRLFPRVLAPFLVAATFFLFASGVLLVLSTPGHDNVWRQVHTASFFIWFWLMAAHVLTYIRRALFLSATELPGRGQELARPALTRTVLLAGSVLLGVALAVAFLPSDTAWAHFLSAFHHDG